MANRFPAPSALANANAAFSIVVGQGQRQRIWHVGKPAAVMAGVAAVVATVWTCAVTAGFVFRDDLFTGLINQQTEMQYAYEDRLATLRNQVDKLASRQLIDQNSLEGKVHELLARQAQLETRHAAVSALVDTGPRTTGSITPTAARNAAPRREEPTAGTAVRAFAPTTTVPAPVQDMLELRKAPSAEQRQGVGERRWNQTHFMTAPPAVAIEAARDFIERTERQQIAALQTMTTEARERAMRWSQVFQETGLDATRFATSMPQPKRPAPEAGGVGGPLVPLGKGSTAVFEQKLSELRHTLQQSERLRGVVLALPVHRPLPADFDITSSYGPRSDPFTRSMAMHTGIDFRAPSGSAVRVTAGGRVVEAGWVGGYGNMVEVDHGHGLTTRYAHLSSIAVDSGTTVKRGDVIGKVGSTGRSTGPHLHYETRLDGESMDPMRFLRAAQRLGIH